MRPPLIARVAVLTLVAGSTLALLPVTAASAAEAVSPLLVGNDGAKAFTVSSAGTFLDPGQEKVVLHANPTNGHADVTGTVTSTGTCSGGFPPLSDNSCTGPLLFTADTTNLPSGTYQVIETQTPGGLVPGTPTTRIDGTVTVFAQPRFAASAPITPAALGQRSTSKVTITGTGFKTGITASFGAGTTASNVQVVSPTQLTVDVDVDAAAVTGTRDVVLTSPDDGATAGTKATDTRAAGLTINLAPTLTSIAPSSGTVGVKSSVTLTGSGFVSGPSFVLNIPQVTVANLVVVNATTVTADLTPNPGAVSGPHSPTVINPDGGSASLAGGYTVIAPPSVPRFVTVTAGDASAYLTWAPPLSAGTSDVTGYRITTSGGIPVATTTNTMGLVTGLTNGVKYTFTVAAQNAAAGFGLESTPVDATPKYNVLLTAKGGVKALTSGQSTVISGTLLRSGNQPIPGATVTLKYVPQIGAAVVRTITTNLDGSWSDTPQAFVYTTSVSVTYPGTDMIASKNVAVAVNAGTRVTVTSPRSGTTSPASSVLTITGTTSPNKSGHDIYLFKTLAGGTLQALVKAPIAANGTFVLKVRLSKGAYGLRMGTLATPGNTTGYSAGFTHRRT